MLNETKSKSIISFLWILESMDIGFMLAIKPNTRPILAVLEPIAFPTARFDSLFNAATIETRISGAEVANATIVRPITMIGIFRICAIDATPLTK